MHHHSLAPIATAQRLLATERDQLRAERDAFSGFADRVRSLDVGPSAAAPSPAVGRPLASASDSAVTEDVRRAYRETVLAVDHYEEVYGESLTTNAHNELGADIAARLGDEGPVTAPFVDALLTAVEQSAEERGALLDHLESEATSLKDAHSTLSTVTGALSERFESRTEDGTSSASLSERCEAVVRSRQSLIQSRHISPLVDGHDLCSYLYDVDDTDWTYPVLTVAATLQRDVEASRRREQPID